MNFLLLGAGRRVSFIEFLKQKNINVFCYEAEPETPASKICDVIDGLKWDNKNVDEHVFKIIKEKNISCVIPLMDRAITFLSNFKNNYKNKLEDVYFVCPNKISADISLDKKLFEDYILKNFDNLYPKLNNKFPIFAKPRYGFGSKGLKTVNSKKELKALEKENYVFQKYCKNIEEYSVDCFYDEGNLVDCVPRIRLRVANGEVLDSITFESPELTKICEEIGNNLSYDGPACIQFMRDKDTNNLYIMEINARFGGGCILSLKSGFDMLKCILEKINKQKISHVKNSWKKNLVMKRVNVEFYFEK